MLAILFCQAAGIVGSLFTAPAIKTWYVTLNKPSFNPPNWLFAPVWTILFLLMGISFFLILEKGTDKKARGDAFFVFIFQFILNVEWSILFFGLNFLFAAFIEIIILWVAILATIIKFYKVYKPAAYLLIPYFLWVTFASVLNFFIWRLN